MSTLPPLPAPDPTRPQRRRGLEAKFHVARVDGRDLPGRDREGADYLVLDLRYDPHALGAALAYAAAVEGDYPGLAADLRVRVGLAEVFGGPRGAATEARLRRLARRLVTAALVAVAGAGGLGYLAGAGMLW